MAGDVVSILMAEDDPDDRDLASLAFSEIRLANPLHCVSDGMELLDYLKQRGAYADRMRFPIPGVILPNLNMPRMDGREALRMIRADSELKHLPVVMMTSSPAEADLLRSSQTGVNSFLSKPITAAALTLLRGGFEDYWLQVIRPPGARSRLKQPAAVLRAIQIPGPNRRPYPVRSNRLRYV